ncbi:MAG: acyl-CoA dehydrogenase family protein [Acidimicrobiales bacterium]
MKLSLTDRQEAHLEAMRALLRARSSSLGWEQVVSTEPGYDRTLWADLAAGGWISVGFPESVGGAGGGVTDLVAAAEALGEGPVPTPFHGGIVLSGRALWAASPDDHRLRSLLSGERRFVFCPLDGSGGTAGPAPAVEATPTTGGWRLDGQCDFVPYGADAEVLLVVAAVRAPGGRGGPTLMAVDAASPGVTAHPVPSLGGDRLCHLSLADVAVEPTQVVGEVGDAPRWLPGVLDIGRLAVSAEMVGAASAALAHACRRAGERTQFGVPIGSQQAVQHRLADALMDVVTARDAVYDAAGVIDRGEEAHAAVAGAKAYCSGSCRRVTAAAHQVCGGEGIYADQPLHLWHRRVAALVPVLGGVQTLRAAVASTLLDD